MTSDSEITRRRTTRVLFRTPRPAKFSTHEVYVLDLSLHGAGIRHQVRLAIGTEGLLRFRLEKQPHEVRCRVLRSKLELAQTDAGTVQTYRTGIEFVGHENEAATVREAMKKRVHRAVLLQKANALGRPDLAELASDPSTKIEMKFLAPWLRPKPFIRCTVDKRGRWKSERVSAAEQPDSGFTILAEEGDAEVEKLRKAWEQSDAEQRRLIQLFAHLSLTETSDESRDQFEP